MMSQSNLDYLFQVTSPVGDRLLGGAGASGFDRPGFGDHLAQASGAKVGAASIAERRERPAPSGPLDSDRTAPGSRPIDNDSSKSDSSPHVYGACEEPDSPAACGDDEPDSPAAETDAAREDSDAASSAPSAAQSDANEESESESNEENESLADAAVIDAAGGTTVNPAASSLPSELTDAVDDAGQTSSTEEAEADSVQSASRSNTNRTHVTSELSDDARKLDVESKFPQAVQPGATSIGGELQAVTVASAESSAKQPDAVAADKSTRKPPNAQDERQHTNDVAARGSSAAVNALATTTGSQNTADGTRRSSNKPKPTDDSRRRTNDKGDPRTAQRTDAAAVANQAAGNAMVNEIRVDAVSRSATGAGEETGSKAGNAGGAKSDALLHPLVRGHRGHAVAGRAGRADNAGSLPRIDTARFVGRVAKAIQTANERGGALQLRLSPPELGSLRLQLTVHEGVMTASLEAESPAARQLLLDHLPSLRERLAEQNIRIERFDVDVRQDGSGGQADPRASQQDEKNQQFQHSTSRRDTAHAHRGDGATPESTTLRSRITDNGLNVLA